VETPPREGPPTSETQDDDDDPYRVGQAGHLVHLQLLPSPDRAGENRLLGFFAEDLQGLAFPAACVAAGELCLSLLPAELDDWITPSTTGFDPDRDRTVWVGDRIYLGALPVDFVTDPDAGVGWYERGLDVLPIDDALDVVLGGEWGTQEVEALLPLATPIEVLDPGIDDPFDLASLEQVLFAWTPGSGEVFLEVAGPEGYRRLYWLEDDGDFAFDVGSLGTLELGDVATFDLFRVLTNASTLDGHTLTAHGISIQRVTGSVARPHTCQEHLDANPSAVSGIYEVQPGAALPVDVYCDMDTDQGGWTLVASSANEAIDDAAGPWQSNLTTLSPLVAAPGVWDGLRDVISAESDIRFACKQDALANAMTVDLSFYDTVWYREITTGTDADSCFNEQNGAGYDQPAAARKNNLTGESRALGDDWETAGYLEGEDSCPDTEDFTIDYSDRGMDGNQSDGTDWGEDDGSLKCGTEGLQTGVWFVFVRES